MLKILNIIGTRPEAIKMAPVIIEQKKQPNTIQSYVCSTGQHKELLDPIFSLFNICTDFNLETMRSNQDLLSLTSRILAGLSPIIYQTKPDWILAQGDTTTVLAASLAAYYSKIRFAHIEAGLRTGDKYQPFPEEGNRIVADALADRHFTPTQRNRLALLSEGIPDSKIEVVGNTVIDSLLMMAETPYDWKSGALCSIPKNKRLVMVTAHRRENHGAGIVDICNSIKELATIFEKDNVHFVLPVHPNPNIKTTINDILSNIKGVSLIEPLDYLSQVHLLKSCCLVLTDSGGIQEEAPSFNVPILILRETTERPEGIETGHAKLIGTNLENIISEASKVLSSYLHDSDIQSTFKNPYGDGMASKRIIESLTKGLSN